MSDTDSLKAYLTDNPRMIGVLFTVTLLLSQAGGALAREGTSIAGP
jgi:hypothetical protein